MNTATHSVVVPFPQAFASPARSPFPSAPRYGAMWLTRGTSDREVGMTPLPNTAEILRPFLLFVLWLVRSCFYLKERFTLEPAKHDSVVKVLWNYSLTTTQKWKWRMSLYIFIHPWHTCAGLSKKNSVTETMQLFLASGARGVHGLRRRAHPVPAVPHASDQCEPIAVRFHQSLTPPTIALCCVYRDSDTYAGCFSRPGR